MEIQERINLESQILSSVINTGRFYEVSSILKPINFMDPFHRIIYTAMNSLTPNKTIDLVCLTCQIIKENTAYEFKSTSLKLTKLSLGFSSLFRLKQGAIQLLEIDMTDKFIQILKSLSYELSLAQLNIINDAIEIFEKEGIDIINAIIGFPNVLEEYRFPENYVSEVKNFANQVDERTILALNNTLAENLIDELFKIPGYTKSINSFTACKHLAQLITEIWTKGSISNSQLNQILSIQL